MISMDVMCVHNKKAEPERYCAYCEVDRLTQAIQRVRDLCITDSDAIALVSVDEVLAVLDGEQ